MQTSERNPAATVAPPANGAIGWLSCPKGCATAIAMRPSVCPNFGALVVIAKRCRYWRVVLMNAARLGKHDQQREAAVVNAELEHRRQAAERSLRLDAEQLSAVRAQYGGAIGIASVRPSTGSGTVRHTAAGLTAGSRTLSARWIISLAYWHRREAGQPGRVPIWRMPDAATSATTISTSGTPVWSGAVRASNSSWRPDDGDMQQTTKLSDGIRLWRPVLYLPRSSERNNTRTNMRARVPILTIHANANLTR